MLTERVTTLKFDGYMLEPISIDNRIGQGDPLSMVIYQFYNADLLEIPANKGELAIVTHLAIPLCHHRESQPSRSGYRVVRSNEDFRDLGILGDLRDLGISGKQRLHKSMRLGIKQGLARDLELQ